MIKQGGKLYKRRTAGIHERLLAYHDNVPNRETRTHSGSGLLIYGIRMDTGESAPFLFIKTKWIDKEIKTQIPIPSNYVIVRKPIDLIVVDLSEYDNYVPDFDAYIVNLGGDFALDGGLGAGLQFVLIPRGDNRGLYIYGSSLPNMNFGLVGSIGASISVVDFNEKSGKRLDPYLFEGKAQGWGIGGSIGPIGFGRGKSTSYKDGKWHSLTTEKDTITYEAYFGAASTKGFRMDAGLNFWSWLGKTSWLRKTGAGGVYTFSESELIASFPF